MDVVQRQVGGGVRVGVGMSWKTRGWVWCSYLLCADENMSLPAGCCSLSGQGRRPCGERDYGHIIPGPCL